MKKQALVLLFLLLILLITALTACNSTPIGEEQTSSSPDGTSSPDSGTASAEPVSTEPADPLASVDRKEDKRDEVIAEMVKMATIEWRPKTDIDLTGIHSSLSFSLRSRYVGMPYVNVTDTPYDDFVASLDNGVYAGPTTRETCMGVDCSSSIFLTYET